MEQFAPHYNIYTGISKENENNKGVVTGEAIHVWEQNSHVCPGTAVRGRGWGEETGGTCPPIFYNFRELLGLSVLCPPNQ